ncbi:MAG: class I SAM-dependent methyltransferase [Trebonia sp.]
MEPRLLNREGLTRSAVVANCAMNRERQLEGPNSYARELGFHPLEWLRTRLPESGPASDDWLVSWLDLCCGTGRALMQAADQVRNDGLASQISLIGVDLVDYFVPGPEADPPLRLICADVSLWTPESRPESTFDLITCVHGLHYIGDKLAVLARAATWLADDGRLVADFDPACVRLPGGGPAGRALISALRQAGFTYSPRRHRITCAGRREVALPYSYLGADDQAGPGYTGQPAVNSYYRRLA